MGAQRSDGDDDEVETTRRTCLQAAGLTGAAVLGIGTKADRTAAEPAPNGGYGGTPELSEASSDLSAAPADRASRLQTGTRYESRLRRRDAWHTFEADDGETLTVRFGQQTPGVSAVGLYGPDGDLVQQAFANTERPVYLPATTEQAGTHYLQIADVSGDRGGYELSVSTDTTTDQAPYEGTVTALPGRVQAEDFDTGGEGVAYHDTDEENVYGDTYRSTGVDVRETQDTSGGYNVGYFEQGEWLEYTVDPTPGTYEIGLRVATARTDRRLRLSLDGEELATVTVSTTGGWRSWETITVSDVAISTDTQSVLRVECLDSGIDLNWIDFTATKTQEPFGGQPVELPGRVQAENFDTGGENVAYDDTTAGNEYGDVYRESDVDIRETLDTGGYTLGYVAEGEWLEYTVTPTSGTYDLTVRVATPRQNRGLQFTLDGEEVATVTVSDTGGWRSWETITVSDVSLPTAESAVLRVTALDDGIDLDWIEFQQTGTNESPTQNPFEGTVAQLPGRVQAENFDTGGEGVSYHDTTAGNEFGDTYRSTDVDVRESQDTGDGFNLGYVADGEWVEYTVDPAPGTYDVRVRVATPNSGRELRLLLNGRELGTVSVPATGGWRAWETATLNDVTVDRDAESVLRIEAVGDGIDLNWVEFAPSSDYGEVAYGTGGYGRNTVD